MPKAAPTHKPTARLPRYTRRNEAEQVRRRQQRRKYATNSRPWREIRARQLAEEPCCRDCRKGGRLTPGTHVDHIDGDSWNNAAENLQTLCAPHHSRKTAAQDGGFGNRGS